MSPATDTGARRRGAWFGPFGRHMSVTSSTISHIEGRGAHFRMIWLNRPFYGFTFYVLRLDQKKFWLWVLALQVLIIVLGVLAFWVVGGQQKTLAFDLALQSVGLSVRERQATKYVAWCRMVTAFLAYGQRLYEWVVSALIILRIFRGVSRGRFTFSKHAVIHDGQLLLRIASNRPSTVLGLSFTIEAVTKPWKYVPLALTNGNNLSMMHDVAMHIRHDIDGDSPFAQPDWRSKVVGISVTVVGYDELLCDEVAGRGMIAVDEIVSGAKFDDMVPKESERVENAPPLAKRGARHQATFDYLRLDKISLVV